jgi:hypothetical protein
MPYGKGFASACAAIAFIAVCLLPAGVELDLTPSAELMAGLAQAGVGFLIAYSVAISAVGRRLAEKSSPRDHSNWLGFTVGCGTCGLLGIAIAFATSAHREAGHAGLLDTVGLCWTASSIGMLGIVITALPKISYSWDSPS